MNEAIQRASAAVVALLKESDDFVREYDGLVQVDGSIDPQEIVLAVIRSLREPTTEMMLGTKTFRDDVSYGQIWREMVDVVLADTTSTAA